MLSQVSDFQSYSGSHFALQTDGSLWAWGDNPYGNLGNGTMDYVEHPVKITDHVVAVSPYSATLAVKQDGSLWGWGSDSNGQLGQGSTTWSATPIYIMGGVKLPEETEDVPRSDTPSPWAQDVVSAAIAAGLVPENLQQNYTEAVSRGEVAEMFIRLLEKSSGKDINAILAEKGVQINPTAFTDTTDKNVLAANALGIINGVGNNRFDPNGTFTRAQIAAILNRTAEKAEKVAEQLHAYTGIEAVAGPLTKEALDRAAANSHIVAQCTSLGLNGHAADFAYLGFIEKLPKDALIEDAIFNPLQTSILKAGAAAGLVTINGISMLANQMDAIIEFYFGIDLGVGGKHEAASTIIRAMRDRSKSERS